MSMRVGAIAFCTVFVAGGLTGLTGLSGCDGSLLEPLRADLALTPEEVAVTSWIGFTSRVSFTATNSGRAALDLEVPLLAPIEGLDLLEGREILDGTSVSVAASPGGPPLRLDELRIEAGRSLSIDVTLAPTREGTSTLVLVLTPEDGEIAPASASIALDARLPPSCEPNGPCENAAFDATLGACVRQPRPDGATCDDASACTTDDRCSQGTCVGEAVTCGDSIGCTVDACEPSVGCLFTPVNERCGDENPCTTDVCSPVAGCTNATAPDGTLCGPFSCEELSTCFFGACVSAPTPDGFPCEDGNLCTSGDVCALQECVPGDDVEPVAQQPVALTRPPLHLSYEARWFTQEEGDSSLPAPDIDVDIAFGAVLDIAQGIVGARPTLAVLWRSQPFDVDGLPCSPWDMWRVVDTTSPSFCASAIVVTFVDEVELTSASASGMEAGTSLVLDVIYGTAGASFAARAPGPTGVMEDELRVVLVESTYYPHATPMREVHMTRAAFSFAARALVERTDERLFTGPAWETSRNVHAGVRVAADDEGETFIGWDLPFAELARTDGDGEDSDPEGDRVAIDVTEFAFRASLDRGTVTEPGDEGSIMWSSLVSDDCAWEPYPAEENSWLDVDVARAEGRAWALARHRDLIDTTSGCEPEGVDAMQLSAVEIDDDDDDGPIFIWQLGTDVRSASLTDRGSVLARLHEHGFDFEAYTLDMLPRPFDTSPDPSIQLESVALDTAEGFPIRVAALDDDAGVLGAVLIESDIYSGQHRVRLIDAVDGSVVAVDLASAFFDVPAVVGPNRVRALRSPLTPQRVYAVLPGVNDDGTDDGVVVTFGCPFPTLP